MAVSIFAGRESTRAPRSWAEQAYPNLIYFNEVDKGGHFAAWEQPELLSGRGPRGVPLAEGLERTEGATSCPSPTEATTIRPFRLDVPEEQLADLRRRIEATRWPSSELVDDRSQGVQLATMQALARYWLEEYDWRKCEARLNAVPNHVTEIDGLDIHFIHVRSPHEDAMPLIMTHGWPGSVVELLETVGPLTDPTAHGGDAEDAFHLVLPSLPGYGLSAEPRELGWDAGHIGLAWAELMKRLGYTRYVAQGGDVGAAVTDVMSRQAPDGLLGVHTNLLVAALGIADQLPTESEQERAALARVHRIQGGRLRLLPGDGHAAADDRLRAAGLTGRPRGLDARPRHGQLLQDRPARSSTASRPATSPGTTSSTTSRSTG